MDVAVIDTGIDRVHPDLNVVDGTTCLTTTCSGNGDDDHYHGTHVAGTTSQPSTTASASWVSHPVPGSGR